MRTDAAMKRARLSEVRRKSDKAFGGGAVGPRRTYRRAKVGTKQIEEQLLVLCWVAVIVGVMAVCWQGRS